VGTNVRGGRGGKKRKSKSLVRRSNVLKKKGGGVLRVGGVENALGGEEPMGL